MPNKIGPSSTQTHYKITVHTGPPIFPNIENFENGGWKIINDEGKIIASALNPPPDPDNPSTKKLIMRDGTGSEVFKVSIEFGKKTCTVITSSGDIIGETKTSFGFCCCCVFKPKYKLHSPSGRNLLIMNGRISCTDQHLKIKVISGISKARIATMEMGDGNSFQCHLDIDNTKITEQETNLIFAVSFGMTDFAYAKMGSRYELANTKNELTIAKQKLIEATNQLLDARSQQNNIEELHTQTHRIIRT